MIWWKIFFRAGGSAHWRSFKEIFIVLIISTSPLYLGALAHYFIAAGSPGGLSSLLIVIQRGELFLYCMSIVGTIVWLANKEWLSEFWSYPDPNSDRDMSPSSEDAGGKREQDQGSDRRVLSPKWIFNLFSILAYGICSMFFGIELVKVRIDSGSLILLSSVIYAASIVFWYIINVLSAVEPPNIEQGLNAGVRDLTNRLRDLRSGRGA